MRAVAGKRAAGGVTVLLALLCGGGAASAVAAPFPLVAEFELRGSKGYEISGRIFGNLAVIDAMSGKVGAEYQVEGKRSGNRFKARFGRLGRIALEFRPANRRQRCQVLQRGIYSGAVDFVGERQYTRVHANKVPGTAFTFPSDQCLASASAAGPPPIVTHLHAVAKRPGGAASVSAFQIAGRGRVVLIAERHEQRKRMSVVRYGYALLGGRNAFLASGPDKHPAFAIVKPPKPFSGGALFTETGPAASSWTGDLAVWLPGAGRVPLSGPDFSSNLCRRRADEVGCAIEPTVRRPLSTVRRRLANLQGSGSQSQLLADARLSWSRYLRNSASSAGSTP